MLYSLLSGITDVWPPKLLLQNDGSKIRHHITPKWSYVSVLAWLPVRQRMVACLVFQSVSDQAPDYLINDWCHLVTVTLLFCCTVLRENIIASATVAFLFPVLNCRTLFSTSRNELSTLHAADDGAMRRVHICTSKYAPSLIYLLVVAQPSTSRVYEYIEQLCIMILLLMFRLIIFVSNTFLWPARSLVALVAYCRAVGCWFDENVVYL